MNTDRTRPTHPTLEQLTSEDGSPLVEPPKEYPNYELTRYRVTNTSGENFRAERFIPPRTLEYTGYWQRVYNVRTLDCLRRMIGV